MSDASRFVASQYLLDGRFVPGGIATSNGFDSGGTRLAPACPRGVLAFPLAGKCKSVRARFVLLEAARAAARFEREISMESCLVALSTSRGGGLSGREPQSWAIKVL
jgi:hypothetical protein